MPVHANHLAYSLVKQTFRNRLPHSLQDHVTKVRSTTVSKVLWKGPRPEFTEAGPLGSQGLRTECAHFLHFFFRKSGFCPNLVLRTRLAQAKSISKAGSWNLGHDMTSAWHKGRGANSTGLDTAKWEVIIWMQRSGAEAIQLQNLPPKGLHVPLHKI